MRYLIVGLGNPGKKYENNRHNVGWKVLDEIARRYKLAFDKTEKKALTASGNIGEQRVLLAKPQTYMNASGEAVRGLVDFYKIDVSNILVVSDDLDLPLGTLRLRQSGGAGGQRGVRSIIQHLGTNEFSRIRFGIGRPPGKMDPAAYVLQDFQGDDQILAQEVVDQAASAVEVWLREGIEAAMTRYNGDIRAAQDTTPQVDPEAELGKFVRAHELAPNDPGPIDRIIGVLKRLGRVEEAANWHLKAADIFDARGKAEKAIGQRERAASLQPQRLDLHRQIAAAYLETGNKRKAVQRLLSMAAYLEAHHRPEEALDAVEEALVINPEHPKALAMAEKLRTRQPD